jgi:hypothetical protein
MPARLIEIKQSELNPTLRALSEAGVSTDDAAWMRSPGNAALVAAFVREQRDLLDKHPFEQTVEEQLTALRRQNELGGWGIGEDVFVRLTETAPAWPRGRDAYRSLRVRFGQGRDGMIKTFEAHAAAVKRVHEPKFWRWEFLLSGSHPYKGKDIERLRLLNGNDSHQAVVEWVIIPDLSAHRQRDSITAVRGPKSLADEGLVLAWLVPNRVRAIDYQKWCAFFLGGYEVNVPEYDGEPWQDVVLVYRFLRGGAIRLNAHWRGNFGSGYSVPPVG